MGINLRRVGWEDGTQVTPARVQIGGTTYDVSDPQYSGTTPLTAQNLKLMENNTEDAINETITYSTTEKVIGIWIDGKPLYRKVVDTGALPNASGKNIPHNISNLKRVIRLYGYAYQPAGDTTFPLPCVNSEIVGYQVALRTTGANITISTGNVDRTNFTESYVVIEYTKTTD